MGNHRRFDARARWHRLGVNKHLVAYDACAVGRDFLCERRRRLPGVREVLVAVPGTSHASVDDFAFAEGAVLVLAYIGDSGDLAVVLEDGHTLAGAGDDAGTFFRD